MTTVNSISGGGRAHKADYNVFALVRTSDEKMSVPSLIRRWQDWDLMRSNGGIPNREIISEMK